MGFASIFLVAVMPILQFLLIGLLGAILASEYINYLSAGAQKNINKVTFVLFIPSIVFASLVKTVTLKDLISWWYMPINIGMTFLIGRILGWMVVKILQPERHLQGLVIANCSAANLGHIPMIIIPPICKERGNLFGEASICQAHGLSYVAISFALSAIFIWTHTYGIMRRTAVLYNKIRNEGQIMEHSKDSESRETRLLVVNHEGCSTDIKMVPLLSSSHFSGNNLNLWDKIKGILHKFVKELLTPPTIAAIVGLIVGVIPWLKSLIIGETAPLRVIQDTISLLGNGMLPCVILILGGNLTQGFRKKSALRPLVIILIIIVRYVILPISGIAVVKAAGQLGFLPQDPLYRFVLLLQFALPPATSIGTMTELFDVAKEECSVIFLWTYLASTLALTVWSTIFMWLLT